MATASGSWPAGRCLRECRVSVGSGVAVGGSVGPSGVSVGPGVALPRRGYLCGVGLLSLFCVRDARRRRSGSGRETSSPGLTSLSPSWNGSTPRPLTTALTFRAASIRLSASVSAFFAFSSSGRSTRTTSPPNIGAHPRRAGLPSLSDGCARPGTAATQSRRPSRRWRAPPQAEASARNPLDVRVGAQRGAGAGCGAGRRGEPEGKIRGKGAWTRCHPLARPCMQPLLRSAAVRWARRRSAKARASSNAVGTGGSDPGPGSLSLSSASLSLMPCIY